MSRTCDPVMLDDLREQEHIVEIVHNPPWRCIIFERPCNLAPNIAVGSMRSNRGRMPLPRFRSTALPPGHRNGVSILDILPGMFAPSPAWAVEPSSGALVSGVA